METHESQEEYEYEIQDDVQDQNEELGEETEYIQVQSDEHGNLLQDEHGNLIQFVPADHYAEEDEGVEGVEEGQEVMVTQHGEEVHHVIMHPSGAQQIIDGQTLEQIQNMVGGEITEDMEVRVEENESGEQHTVYVVQSDGQLQQQPQQVVKHDPPKQQKVMFVTRAGNNQPQEQVQQIVSLPASQTTAVPTQRLIQIGGQTILVQTPSYSQTVNHSTSEVMAKQQKIVLRPPPQQQQQPQVHIQQTTPQQRGKQVILVKQGNQEVKPQVVELQQSTPNIQVIKSPQKIAPRVVTSVPGAPTLQTSSSQMSNIQISQNSPKVLTINPQTISNIQPVSSVQSSQYVVVKQTSSSGAHTFSLQPATNIPSYDGVIERSVAPASSKKPCNCTKSQCLKLYCDCFANGEFCSNCNCLQCYNNLEHEEERAMAVRLCLDRNPNAFHPKIGKYKPGDKERRHTKGCNCKRSGCLKNYCECYEARILCSSVCRCVGCHNIEENMDAESLLTIKQDLKYPQPKSKFDETLKHLASVCDKDKNINRARSPPPIPELKLSSALIDATCDCLLSRAAESSEENATAAILQEFGHCLAATIEAANERVASKNKY